jgi:hypothetical protein
MTEAELQRHRDHRAGQAARFIIAPHAFQVCGHCSSVVRRSAPYCPYCGGYRWITDDNEVTRVALLIGNKPFPSTGVAPRLQSV